MVELRVCTSFILLKTGLLGLRITVDISASGKSYEKNLEERHVLVKMTNNVNVLNSVKHA